MKKLFSFFFNCYKVIKKKFDKIYKFSFFYTFSQESIASQLSDHCNQSLYKVEQKLEDERLVMLYRKQK